MMTGKLGTFGLGEAERWKGVSPISSIPARHNVRVTCYLIPNGKESSKQRVHITVSKTRHVLNYDLFFIPETVASRRS